MQNYLALQISQQNESGSAVQTALIFGDAACGDRAGAKQAENRDEIDCANHCLSSLMNVRMELVHSD